MSKHSAFHPEHEHDPDMTAGVQEGHEAIKHAVSHAKGGHNMGFHGKGKKSKPMKEEGGKGMEHDEECEE